MIWPRETALFRRRFSVVVVGAVIVPTALGIACGGRSDNREKLPGDQDGDDRANQGEAGGTSGDPFEDAQSGSSGFGGAAGLDASVGLGGQQGPDAAADGGTPAGEGGATAAIRGAACGDETCDLERGQVCCWSPETDTHSCAFSCDEVTEQVLECDEDSDCPSGTKCSLVATPDTNFIVEEGTYIQLGLEHQTGPYSSRCLEPSAVTIPAECRSTDSCSPGQVCCVYQDDTYKSSGFSIPQTVGVYAIRGISCVAPEDCPGIATQVPACETDVDCEDGRTCEQLEDSSSAFKACWGIAPDSGGATVACGNTECAVELALSCCFPNSNSERVQCQVWCDADARTSAACDDHGDCPDSEKCGWFSDGTQSTTYCSTAPFFEWGCHTLDGCPDGEACCVTGSVFDGTVRAEGLSCETTEACSGDDKHLFCNRDEDCPTGMVCGDVQTFGWGWCG